MEYDTASVLSFVPSGGYLLIFIAMVIEGPSITAAAAFAASLGYLNIFIIFFLSLAGDLTGDCIHYYFGRFLRKKVIDGYMKSHGIKKGQVNKLEKKIHNNLWKSMMIIKMTPPLSTPGLLLIGASKVDFRRYLLNSLIATLPLTIFYTCLGYYFGFAVKNVLGYFEMGQYALFFIILAVIMVFFLYKVVYKKILKRIEAI
ncbi:MAG: VTT domain-containing protein [Candidatus Pacearchaeota archaeon]|jgi:membrane protein DedA with SNARE-associated domain